MKRLLTAAIAVSVLATAGMANAQGPQRDNGHHDQGPQRNDDHRASDRHDDNSWERHATKRYKANRYQPPRGYQYVRVNNDVVLTAIATGVVASVIYQLFQ